MPATIRDVALRARVSVATVSRALSGRRRVSEENRRRVIGAAAELNYRPNLVASSLRRQVTNTIGLVIPQISNPFFPTLVESIEWQLQSTTRQLLLCDSRGDPELEQLRLQALVDRQVDGIMISPCDAVRSAEAVHAAALEVPLVQIDRRITGDATDWVGVDDEVGMRLVVEHVARAGAHRGLRRLGTDELLRAVAPGRFYFPVLGLWSQDLGAAPWGLHRRLGNQAARVLLEGKRVPDAVVCGNDLIAIGLLRQFLLAGVAFLATSW